MAGTAAAKRKAEEARLRSRPNKRFKKQTNYDSSSSGSEADNTSTINSRQKETKSRRKEQSSAEAPQNGSGTSSPPTSEVEDGSQDEDDASSQTPSSADSDADADPNGTQSESRKRKTSKRHDPTAFASSISAILSSKVSSGTRSDPVLSRSKEAAEASRSLVESRLEAKARRKLREEKRAAAEKGRIRNVLLGDRRRTPGLSESEVEEGAGGRAEAGLAIGREKKTGRNANATGGGALEMSAAEIAEQERRFRKTAQRGVVKLFNAVRSAQVSSEKAEKEAKKTGLVGMKQRQEKVGEMGRQAFLDLVSTGKTDVS